MSALQKLVDRCNEMDITEQTNWLGDPTMAYQAKAELARITRLQAIEEAVWKLMEHPTSEATLQDLARVMGVNLS